MDAASRIIFSDRPPGPLRLLYPDALPWAVRPVPGVLAPGAVLCLEDDVLPVFLPLETFLLLL